MAAMKAEQLVFSTAENLARAERFSQLPDGTCVEYTHCGVVKCGFIRNGDWNKDAVTRIYPFPWMGPRPGDYFTGLLVGDADYINWYDILRVIEEGQSS